MVSEAGRRLQAELEALLPTWQRRLRLQDWSVRVKVVRQADLSDPNCEGDCLWTLTSRSAIVRILDPIDYPADNEWPNDPEDTLVHELVHLHMAPFKPEDGLQRVAMEQAVTALSGALVGMKREAGSAQEPAQPAQEPAQPTSGPSLTQRTRDMMSHLGHIGLRGLGCSCSSDATSEIGFDRLGTERTYRCYGCGRECRITMGQALAQMDRESEG